LGLIFLKYISDAFEELYQKLVAQQKSEGADPEDKNEYTAEKVFYVPPSARWKWLQGRAKLPTIGKDVDDAMEAIEKDNPASLRGVLPKVFAQEKLDKQSLGGLIDLVGSAALGTKEAQSKDVLGRVFEYFLGEFALDQAVKASKIFFCGEIKDVSEEELVDIFSDVPSTEIAKDQLGGAGMPLIDLMVNAGITKSKGEARRAIQGGGIYLENIRVTDVEKKVLITDAFHGKFIVLRKGARNYWLVKVV
jgi:type I restriction enzyme M protein